MIRQNLLSSLCLATLPFTFAACGGGGGGGSSNLPGASEPGDLAILDLGLPAEATLVGPFDPLAEEYVLRLPFMGHELALQPVYANPDAGSIGTIGFETTGFGELKAAVSEGDNRFEFTASLPATGGQRTVRVLVQREFATQFAQNAFIKASNPGQNDAFAAALSIDRQTLVVGAPFEDSGASGVGGDQLDNSSISSGAVYVFVRDGASWRQEAYIKAVSPDANDQFGASVAVSGDLLVVGAPNEDGGGTGALGNPADDSAPDSGAAYVYRRQGGVWSFDAYLKPSNTVVGGVGGGGVGGFGTAVAIAGNTIVVGAPAEDSPASGVNGQQVAQASAVGAGAAYVFVAVGLGWTQQAYLKPFATDGGDSFGCSVALDGDRVVVGARGDDGGGTGSSGNPEDDSVFESGAAYTFVRAGQTWSTEFYVKASNTGTGDQFGSRVALEGRLLAVAARNERSLAVGVDGDQTDNSGVRVGAVYAFVHTGTRYEQEAYIKASNAESDDGFGEGLALRGDMLVVGAQAEDSLGAGLDAGQGNGAFNAGAAYLYVREAGVWTQRRYMKASNARNSGFFGSAVGIAPFGIAVGGSGDNSGSAGVDGSQASIGNFAGHGAVYTYE